VTKYKMAIPLFVFILFFGSLSCAGAAQIPGDVNDDGKLDLAAHRYGEEREAL
jgi:hypothetical protein